MNGSNFNLSSLLYNRGNISCSKEPKYTFKLLSTDPYRRTYKLGKQFQEIECQSNAFFMTYQNTQDLYDTHTNFDLYLLHKYSKVWRVTLKCYYQRKLRSRLANKLWNPFCGRGQRKALLRLRCSFCSSILARLFPICRLFLVTINDNHYLFLSVTQSRKHMFWHLIMQANVLSRDHATHYCN